MLTKFTSSKAPTTSPPSNLLMTMHLTSAATNVVQHHLGQPKCTKKLYCKLLPPKSHKTFVVEHTKTLHLKQIVSTKYENNTCWNAKILILCRRAAIFAWFSLCSSSASSLISLSLGCEQGAGIWEGVFIKRASLN